MPSRLSIATFDPHLAALGLPSRDPDLVTISSLSLVLPNGIGPSAFGLCPAPPCPVIVDLVIRLADGIVAGCSQNDSMTALGVNYSSVSKEIIALVNETATEKTWRHPYELMREIARKGLKIQDVVEGAIVSMELPKASLPAQAIHYQAMFSERARGGSQWACTVRDLRCRTIIGLHEHERRMRQWLEVNFDIMGWSPADGPLDHNDAAERVHEVNLPRTTFNAHRTDGGSLSGSIDLLVKPSRH